MHPAAPFPWVTVTQAPTSAAVQVATAAAVARAVSDASTAPDEPAAEAVTAISPAAEAAAMTAVISRAAFGIAERYVMSCRPAFGTGSAVCGFLCSLRLR